jgi:hypothetical protein
MNTCSAREYTLLAASELLRNWRQQQPRSQGDTDKRVIRKPKRIHNALGKICGFISAPQYMNVFGVTL